MAVYLIPASDTTAPPRPCGNTTATLLVPGWNNFDGPLFVACACCCAVGTLALLLYVLDPTLYTAGLCVNIER